MIHKGLFYNNRIIVSGKYDYENGDTFEGSHCPDDGFKNGRGTMVYVNGDKFVGEWVDDFPSDGQMEYHNNDLYFGQWKNN